MPHTHWDGGPTCRFKTKRECDEWMKWDTHFHPGVPCEMGYAQDWRPSRRKNGTMSKQAETCRLEPERKAAYIAALTAPRTFCLACEYGGPIHGGPGCKRTAQAVERT